MPSSDVLSTDSPAKEELIFEVYFDESSLFEHANQNWIVAGYMRPRVLADGVSTSDSDVVKWWSSVCSWFIRKHRGQIGEYRLAHCSSNILNRIRREIQTSVLNMLCDNIAGVNGFPVVFFCPKGPCTQNSELNYLTVLSYGYLQLLQEIRRRFPDKTVRIVPVISKTDKTKYLAASSTPDEMEKLHQHYRVILGVMLYPYCSIDDLNNILNDLTIIHGNTVPYASELGQLIEPKPAINANLQIAQRGAIKNLSNEPKQNLHNIVADYICNSYYTNIDDVGCSVIANQPNAFLCTVPRDMSAASPISQPVRPEVPVKPVQSEQPKASEQNKEAERMFSAFHADMLEQFNSTSLYEQRSIIRLLCAEIKPLVERQIDMERVLSELNALLELSEKISRTSIRAEMIANLLLFKIALLNHMGNVYAADDLSKDFLESVSKMSDDFGRNSLVSMFFNRQIVLNTDLNNYAKAEEYYLQAEKYWSEHLSDYAGRFKRFDEDFTPNLSNIICPEYSKTIGSILQTARHRMRASSRAERFGIYMTALHRARTAGFHMDEPADLSRIQQTLCDLESEVEFFDSAFQHLWKAAQLLEGNSEDGSIPSIDEQSCLQILSAAGKNGTSNPFLLAHYARLISEMLISGGPSALNLSRAQVMIAALLKQKNAFSPSAYQGIRSIHPRTQILWKLGSAALRTGLAKEGNKLLSAAFEQLVSSDAGIFHSIAVSVRAEQAYFNKANAEMIADIQAVYARFLAEKPETMLDPFEALSIGSMTASDADISQRLLAISRVIAY